MKLKEGWKNIANKYIEGYIDIKIYITLYCIVKA